MVSAYRTDMLVVLQSILKAQSVSIFCLFFLIFSLWSDLLFLRLLPWPSLENCQNGAIIFVEHTHQIKYGE